MATRGIIIDTQTDKESEYTCECGFHEYLGETCNCNTCKSYQLPLTNCPNCGRVFEVV